MGEIQRFSESIELSAMRDTSFYTELRPYVHNRLIGNKWVSGYQILEDDEKQLSIEDRYFLKLDILFGELFKNVKTRQFWKQSLQQLLHDPRVTCLAVEALEKAYLNELVILFERLGRLLVLVKKAFRANVDVAELEIRLLKFFDPLLFKKRNYSHHRMYLGFPGLTELQRLENSVHDQQSFESYYAQFKKRIVERVEWINYTEKAFAVFLKEFLELTHSKIKEDASYIEPRYLAPNFSCAEELKVDIRKRYGHAKLYSEN
jgi:hypothetical protein